MQDRTPTKQTLGFFQQNLVSEYTFPQSVADKVNVDFEVYRIKTKITEKGSSIDGLLTDDEKRTLLGEIKTEIEELKDETKDIEEDIFSISNRVK